MACFIKWPILIATLLSGISVNPQKVFFEQLTTAEGLPSDYVNCVFQDSKGFLWIGTDKGACRYDGTQFQYFTIDDGLTDNFVNLICGDNKGNIYLHTYEGNLCVYDGQRILPFALPPGERFKQAVRHIQFNSDGSFFLTTESLYYFDNKNAEPQKLLGQLVTEITELESDQFLLKAADSIYLLRKKANRFDVEKLYFNPPGQSFFANIHKNSFAVQKGDSLIFYEFKDKILRQRKIHMRERPLPGYLAYLYSKNDEIWIGSNKLLYADKDNKTVYYDRGNGLGGNLIRNLCEDRQGNLYICTYGGGIKIWPRGYLVEYPVKGKVNSILASPEGAYITTTNGLYNFRPATGIIEFKNSTSDDFIAIHKTTKGEFLLASYHSFLRIKSEAALRSLNESPAKGVTSVNSNISISGFWQQNDQRLLVSTYGSGIRVYNNQFKLISTYTKEQNKLNAGMIEFMIPVGNSVAALTFSAGLTVIDRFDNYYHITREDGLLSNTVFSVFQEKNEDLWIGTLHGLNYRQGKKVTRTFSYKEGFTGTKAVCTFRDKKQRLWVLSDKYLHLMENEKLRAIRSHPLLYDNKNPINRAVYDTTTGLLYIGLTNAFLVADMNKVVPDPFIQNPALYAVLSDSVQVKNGTTGFLVPASSKKITFRFGYTYYSIASKPDLYYKLNGFDEEWKLLNDKPEAVYQKLAAGKYELIAKTVSPDGYESQEFSLAKLEILPPVWKRGWFISLSLIILLLGFFYIGHIISRRRYNLKFKRLREEYRLQVERERIARELHDNVGSQLTYLINKLDDDYALLAEKKEADKLSGFARGAMQELRETIWALDKKEISSEEMQNKIRSLLHLYKNNKHEVELIWQANGNGSLRSTEALNIYRIIQEALNNAEKYSGASHIKVSFCEDAGGLVVEVNDNGKGFDMGSAEQAHLADGQGYGLHNMKKRALEMNAEMQIETSPGEGTTVRLHLPLNQPFS